MSSSINLESTARYEEFVFQNPDKHISRIKPESSDFSLSSSNLETLLKQTKNHLESSSISVTLKENKAQSIETIMKLKEPLIKERNKILDNPLKYFLPHYKKKLLKIDSTLDDLDLTLYQLEKKGVIEASDLNEIVLSAQARLQKYAPYLQAEPKVNLPFFGASNSANEKWQL